MTRTRSIAVAQTVPIRGRVSANLEQHIRLVRVAALERAQVVAFPELSLTGYEPDLAEELAFTENDSRLAPLVDAAASNEIIVIAGAPVRIDSRLFIGAFIALPDRRVELYTKHHLGACSAAARCDSVATDGAIPPAEATVFHPGDRNPLVRFGGDVAAVAVCADTGRATHPQAAADRGATIYLASMFVIPSKFQREGMGLGVYATRHAMVIAFANFGGPSGGLASAGRSSIWSEKGELVAQLDARGIGVALAAESEVGWRGKTIMLDRA